jgi:hypothetical protein
MPQDARPTALIAGPVPLMRGPVNTGHYLWRMQDAFRNSLA